MWDAFKAALLVEAIKDFVVSAGGYLFSGPTEIPCGCGFSGGDLQQ